MSIMEIPDQLYRQIYEREVAFGINQGLWLDAARERATEIMQHTFVARSTSLQCETEHDVGEYDDDMSIGGTRYRSVQQ